MTRSSGAKLPAGLVKGVDPAKAGSAEMFARFLVPPAADADPPADHRDTGAVGQSLDPSLEPLTVEPGGGVDASAGVAQVTAQHQQVHDYRAVPPSPDRADDDSDLGVSGAAPATEDTLSTGRQNAGGPRRRTGAQVTVASPPASDGTQGTPGNALSAPLSNTRSDGREVSKRTRESKQRKVVEFPPIPPQSSIPARLDASYIPRQLFIRLPVELRDRLREVKGGLAGDGKVMTDGEIVEAGCRLLPTDLERMFNRCLAYALRRERGVVPFSPQIRSDLHGWLENVNACLRSSGLRVSVNTIALVALEAFVDEAERR